MFITTAKSKPHHQVKDDSWRIIGGEKAVEHSQPWIVRLVHGCSGFFNTSIPSPCQLIMFCHFELFLGTFGPFLGIITFCPTELMICYICKRVCKYNIFRTLFWLFDQQATHPNCLSLHILH